MDSRAAIRLIREDGWYEVRVRGDHHQFRHPTKKGLVTIQHPKKDLRKDVVNSILTQAGLK